MSTHVSPFDLVTWSSLGTLELTGEWFAGCFLCSDWGKVLLERVETMRGDTLETWGMHNLLKEFFCKEQENWAITDE